MYNVLVCDDDKANFDFKNENTPSFFVRYLTPKGDTTIWGKDLERLVAELDIQKGEYVRFGKIGERAEPYSFKKKIQNKWYEVQSARKILSENFVSAVIKPLCKRRRAKADIEYLGAAVLHNFAENSVHHLFVSGKGIDVSFVGHADAFVVAVRPKVKSTVIQHHHNPPRRRQAPQRFP